MGNNYKEIIMPSELHFLWHAHVRFFLSSLRTLPSSSAYAKIDTNRLTLVHFAVQSLDLLGVWDNNNNNNNDNGNGNGNGNDNNNTEGDENHYYDEDIPRLKSDIIDWIYSLRVGDSGGFMGGSYAGPLPTADDNNRYYHHQPHIAHTYCALSTLQALGDSKRIWKNDPEFVRFVTKDWLPKLQRPDGSFQSCVVIVGNGNNTNTNTNISSDDNNNNNNNSNGNNTNFGDGDGDGADGEHDMRFLYCACAISYMINDWSGIHIENAIRYVKSCRSFDGGISLVPGAEGHGGSTFCAVASIVLMNKAQEVFGSGLEEDESSSSSPALLSDDNDSDNHNHNTNDDDSNGNNKNNGCCWRDELIAWCVRRQVTPTTTMTGSDGGGGGGMQGRPNKLEDTCYSYWIGGTLRLLLSSSTSSSSTSSSTSASTSTSKSTNDNDNDDFDSSSKNDGIIESELSLLDQTALRNYVLSCQSSPSIGGFSKVFGLPSCPDLLHSFYSLAWLSLSNSSNSTNSNDGRDSNEREDVDGNNNTIPTTTILPLNAFNCTLGIREERAARFGGPPVP